MKQFKYGFIILGLVLAPAAVYADSWSCRHDNLLREVKITHSGDGPVPCSVIYNKPDEGGESQALWSAESEQGFCEEKAQGLVTRLESWGWICSSDAADAPVEPVEPEEGMAPAQPDDAPVQQIVPGEQADQAQ